MYRLKIITKNSLIFIMDNESEEAEELKITINDNITINEKTGIFSDFYLRLYDVEPYITLLVDTMSVIFNVQEAVEIVKN